MTALRRSAELNLVRCQICGLPTFTPALEPGLRCPRCRARIEPREPFSTDKTLAWLLTGICLYIPANVLPVMHTEGLAGEADSTICGGIMEFWRSGDWDIALLIFIASVAIPLTKFMAIAVLVFSVRSARDWQQRQRTKLYRAVELIGYWSMLDVVVVALTASLVQFQTFATAQPRVGIAFFCAVVIATMFSAQCLDPRLIWDSKT